MDHTYTMTLILTVFSDATEWRTFDTASAAEYEPQPNYGHLDVEDIVKLN